MKLSKYYVLWHTQVGVYLTQVKAQITLDKWVGLEDKNEVLDLLKTLSPEELVTAEVITPKGNTFTGTQFFTEQQPVYDIYLDNSGICV